MEGADFTVEEVVENLGLRPLADGGWGRLMGDGTSGPGGATGVYRLLTPDAPADWRAVEAEELWTAYMGAPLEVELATEAGVLRETLTPGSGLWVTISAGGWLRTRPIGGWCLAGWVGPVQGGGLS